MQHPPKLIPLLNDIFSSAWVACRRCKLFPVKFRKMLIKHFEVNVTGHLCTDQSQKIVRHTCKPQSHRLITSDVC